MQIRESEVKTREAELETREVELKDRQAAMLIRLDEQKRDYTLCDLSLTYQPFRKDVHSHLGRLGELAGNLQQLPRLDDEIPIRPVRQYQAMLLFLQQKATSSGFDPPKRTSIFWNFASVAVEYGVLHGTITVNEVNETHWSSIKQV
jgi:hypothetical protein